MRAPHEVTRAAGAAPDSDGADAVRPREGSTLHYALLWTEAVPRARFLARLSLLRALATTLDDVHDPGVAERKVHWWHEELERTGRGSARHPHTVACQGELAGLDDAGAACLDVLSIAATTRYTPAADDAERRARLARDHGARLALLAHALSGDAADLAAPAIRHPELAFGLGLRDTLARLPMLLHRGYAVFSEADYARHGLTPAALARHVRRSGADGEPANPSVALAEGGAGNALRGIPVVAASPDRHAIVAASVTAAHDALDAALADAGYQAAYSRGNLAPLARLAALRARQLRLWRERSPDLLRETMAPTPLAKLFVAWRHRRGARRRRVE